MVKHIVMFKLKESLSEKEKQEIAGKFKSAIEALPEKINFIRFIHVGININSSEKWDICLESTFDSLEDVKAYSIHPAHVAAVGTIKEVKEDRACVDFEL